jgi:catalase
MNNCTQCGEYDQCTKGLCRKCYGAKWRVEHLEQSRALGRQAKKNEYNRDPEKQRLRMRRWREEHSARQYFSAAKSAWKRLTPEQRNELLKEIPVESV